MKRDDSLDPLLERTSRRAGVRPPNGCLDAETLAAFTDGSLTAAQRSAVEAHTADCDRCLAVLAAIARTSPPPLAAAKPSWLSIRWLVPLTTAAVAITAWMVIGTPSTPQPTAPEAALADAAKADRPEIRTQAKAATPPPTEPLEKKRESAANARQKERDESRRNAQSARKRSDVATDKIAEAERGKPEFRKPEAGSRKPLEAPAAPAATANAPSRAELADERARQQMSAAAALPVTIASPDPAVRWRVVGRAVERSTDSGKTWQSQATGTSIDLLAGASPAVNVCWIVGRNGLVLLTTDGNSWRRLDFPETSLDLVAVTARDGLDATVTAANGRHYRTTDAGRTWTLQEIPAAPF